MTYKPKINPLTPEKQETLAQLKESLGEPTYATFARWDLMVSREGDVYFLESNACAQAFGDIRGLYGCTDGKGSPLDHSVAERLDGRGTIGVNSLGKNGRMVQQIFSSYGIPSVFGKKTDMYLDPAEGRFYFADSRHSGKRTYADLIWQRSGSGTRLKDGRRVTTRSRVLSELRRAYKKTGDIPQIPPDYFFPALSFMSLGSNKYNLSEVISKNVTVPVTVQIKNARQWREQAPTLVEMVRGLAAEAAPEWGDIEIIYKPTYGSSGKGITSLQKYKEVSPSDLKFPGLIMPKIVPAPVSGRPESNVDIGVYSVGLDTPAGLVKIARSGKIQTNLMAGGSWDFLDDGLREDLAPHIQLALLTAERHLREENQGEMDLVRKLRESVQG